MNVLQVAFRSLSGTKGKQAQNIGTSFVTKPKELVCYAMFG